MALLTMGTIILLAVLLLITVGGILLEIFLARRENWWPGLCLPGIAFLGSLLPLLRVSAVGSPGEIVLSMVTAFLMGNIPTLSLLAIYFICREKKRRRRQLDRMHIQELE